MKQEIELVKKDRWWWSVAGIGGGYFTSSVERFLDLTLGVKPRSVLVTMSSTPDFSTDEHLVVNFYHKERLNRDDTTLYEVWAVLAGPLMSCNGALLEFCDELNTICPVDDFQVAFPINEIVKLVQE